MLQSGLTGLNLRRSGSGNSLLMAGGLHLAASSINLETMRDPATPMPRPRAPAVSAAEFWLEMRRGEGEVDSARMRFIGEMFLLEYYSVSPESSWARQADISRDERISLF